jgi:hypothetical protein
MNIPGTKKRRLSNKFLPVMDNWEDYFRHRDEGLGTTYERLMLHRIFSRINEKFQIKTVLEVPSFGMTGISGINSLWWAIRGKQVTMIDNDEQRIKHMRMLWKELEFDAKIFYCHYKSIPLEANSIDLVWNFAALWFLKDLNFFLNDLKRISRKIIFICVPNAENLVFRLRKLLFGRNTELCYKNIHANHIKKQIKDQQWRLSEEGYFDIPPWPDIPVKKEVLLSKFKLDFLLKETDAKSTAASILDYFSGNEEELEKRFKKWQFLENSPKFFQRYWAHHRYFIFKHI